MKWIHDTTGRFERRPYLEQAELDRDAERLVGEFLDQFYGQMLVPIPTGALLKLIERDAADLDIYADLSGEGEGVEGVTYFFPGGPKVRIMRELTEQRHRAHRLRHTLAHEYAHVRLHSGLERRGKPSITRACRGDEMVSASVVDWMEWQASYCAAALLMPQTRVKLLVRAYFRNRDSVPVSAESTAGTDLKQRTSEAFDVSEEAAVVRLSQLGYLMAVPR
jgi:hypothetical protein